MKELIESLKTASAEKNWHAALFIALSIPDICGKFEYPDDNVGKRYKRWFENYLAKFYIHKIGAKKERIVFLNSSDCYALRCALLHEGSDDITTQRAKDVLDSFIFSTTLSHLLKIDNGEKMMLVLNVERFCIEMYSAATEWLETTSSSLKILQIHTSESISF